MQPPEQVFYVAGRVPHHSRGQLRFEFERDSAGRPIVTRNPSGAEPMLEKTHLYKISEDFSRVFLVKSLQPAELDSPAFADLAPEQQRELQELIRKGMPIY